MSVEILTPKPLSLKHLVQGARQAPSAGERPPLLVLLHGVGSNEYDLFGLASYLDPRFVIVSARGPLVHAQSGGAAWYPVTFTPTGLTADESFAVGSRDSIAAFLPEAAEAYGADPSQIWLTGFSQGAAMTIYTLLTHPDLVAGAVPMSGRLIPAAWENRADDDALRGKPVFSVHGLYDQVLPISSGREIRDRLQSVPLDYTYREYPMGHEVSNASLSDITGWLSAKLDAAL